MEAWQAVRVEKMVVEDKGMDAAEEPIRTLIDVARSGALLGPDTIEAAEGAILDLCRAALVLGYRAGFGDATALSQARGSVSRG